MRPLNDLLNDNNLRVKKVMVKIIIAFSTRKVLLDKGMYVLLFYRHWIQ